MVTQQYLVIEHHGSQLTLEDVTFLGRLGMLSFLLSKSAMKVLSKSEAKCHAVSDFVNAVLLDS